LIIEGSVAIVTGAAGGIGSALAQRLLEHGAGVVVTDLAEDRVAATVASLQSAGEGRVVGLAGDCSAEAHIQALIDIAGEHFGPVDLYAANAGVGLGRGLEASENDWATSIDVNVLAHVRAARLLTPGWLERGRGYFLSTASAAGLLTQIGSPTYSVTKHAAVAFAEWMSVTYGSRGIAVSCVCPMGVLTAMLRMGAESGDEVARLGAKAVTEAGRVLQPLEVADVVVKGIVTEQFLILPHEEVREFYRRKGADYDRWLAGMRRYQDSLGT
jgi:NAD(P)-dependent dehydrogenase (short-subunit alcohol dehydrogenase family)